MIITKDNFELFMTKLAYGWNRAQSYSSHSISVTHIQRARSMDFFLETVVLLVDKAGYCAVATMHPILEKHEMYVHEPNPSLKQEIDDDFKVDLAGYNLHQCIEFCEFVYEQETKEV